MKDFTTPTARNPQPGVIFEHSAQGELVVLNPDITVTITKGGLSTTITPSLDTWLTWQADAFDALVGFAPHIKLGAVGLRMADNYEAKLEAARALRQAYVA